MIAVLDYGIGNLRSAQKALLHLGAEVRMATNSREADGASGVVLPGVGAFGASMDALRTSGLDRVVLEVIARDVPFLGICVGYQMLFGASEESVGTRGLDIFSGSVSRLRGSVRLPQMQWNTVRRTEVVSRMLGDSREDEWMYFVHSYVPVPEGEATQSIVGTTNYGEDIAVALERENIWGVQFHPEKSGHAGLDLLGRFVAHCRHVKHSLVLA
ncbi:MAG TPA: imidazole glycerol phosphate synthase subunit HisH [Acidimicrobiales bacterium]|nr:imidazole glycerol phosphate synthase subunit HisH [Acidimicrobiales bacterium]